LVCNWEGNLRLTVPDHWKPMDEYADSPKVAVSRTKGDAARRAKGDRLSTNTAGSCLPAQADPMPREGDTLPVPSPSKAADASADSRTSSKKAPRRASKRAKSAPR